MKQLLLLLIALAAATAINADGIDRNEARSHAKGVRQKLQALQRASQIAA